jgi:methyl-accepting chemotaxis protein
VFWTKLLGNLPLARKFLIFAMLSALLVVLPLIAYLQQSNGDIAAARHEVDGLSPVRQLLKVVQLVQQHRGLAADVLTGNAQAEPQRTATRGEVHGANEAFSRSITERIPDHAIAATWQAAQAEWQSLEQAVSGRKVDTASSHAKHTALVEKLLDVLDLTADHFGLSQEAELDGHHLVMAALVHLPKLAEALAQARERGAVLLSKVEVLSATDREPLVSLAGIAQMHHHNLSHGLGKAMAVNAVMGSRLRGIAGESGALSEQALKLTRQQLLGGAQPAVSGADHARAYTEAINGQFRLNAVQFAVLEEVLAQRISRMRSMQLSVLAAALLLALLAAGLSYAVMRSISRPVNQALGMAHRFSSGDLTQRTGSTMKDEIGRLLDALNAMRGELAASVTDIRIAADSVSAATGEIAHGNSDLSRRTEQQAASLEQTATSMEEFTSTVKQNAENARQANLLAQDAAAVALRGGVAARGVVSTMQGISQSSNKIADIIGVIESIAFQTNILALNAAVEAARAGDQGRGFAVVAAEVRSLAQRSAQAAKEIKGLIQDSAARVGGGVHEVEDAGKTMDEIVASVDELKNRIAEIARASAEQLVGIEQVNSAIMHMDGNTQQNAALVEQAAAAAQHLLDQAHALTASVARFKLEEGLEAQKRKAMLDTMRAGPAMGLATGSAASTLPGSAANYADARGNRRALPLRADPHDEWKAF